MTIVVLRHYQLQILYMHLYVYILNLFMRLAK